MALAGSRTAPRPLYKFILTTANFQAGFAEVSGLSTSPDIIGSAGRLDLAARRISGVQKLTNISLKRGHTSNVKELQAWLKSVTDGNPQRQDGTITLLNEAGRPISTWKFSGAFPVKVVGPSFNATATDVAIEEIELSAEGIALKT